MCEWVRIPHHAALKGFKELILNSFLNIMNKMTIIYLLKYNIKSLGAENIKLLYFFPVILEQLTWKFL